GQFRTTVVNWRAGERMPGFTYGATSENHWAHAVAAAPNGDYTVAHDIYLGDSDVVVLVNRKKGNKSQHETLPVASSSRFEARPSVAYDAKGRLWIAYEEGPEQWGKDYGSLVPDRGSPLYSARSVRVVCLDADGKLKRPAAELPTSAVKAPGMAGVAQQTQR